MNVVGLDLSLTATGIAHADGTSEVVTSKLRGMPRLLELRNHIVYGHLTPVLDCLVMIEGYALGMSRNAQNHATGELGGVIRLTMHECGIPYLDVPPASVKKYATGKGNAAKPDMLGAAIRRLGYERNNDNEADALWLRAMGADLLGSPVVTVPEAHRDALKPLWEPARELGVLP